MGRVPRAVPANARRRDTANAAVHWRGAATPQMPARRRNPWGGWGLRASSSLLVVADALWHRLLLTPRSRLASPIRATHAMTRTGETGVGDVYKNPTSLSLVENHLKNEAKSITYENYNKVFAVIQDAELNGDKKVPYYDVDFTSSFLEVENNQQNTPNYYISHPFFIGCDMVVRNSGQSMAKVIAHGDAIGLVRLNNWRDFFPFGAVRRAPLPW